MFVAPAAGLKWQMWPRPRSINPQAQAKGAAFSIAPIVRSDQESLEKPGGGAGRFTAFVAHAAQCASGKLGRALL
ncbi:hypothetical protein [Paracidovorax valerianellae]|uniref:hypothetical protein n=1 Tax=Paracidovorax valerianellae TaxID=187868 RepID=UPI001113AA98|nr:hypothetical protein [Paracidovorax valerianellae]MDA8443982.1 hypothetical protein [Paracidovorax valerianellae]